jgi:hypothetical protein
MELVSFCSARKQIPESELVLSLLLVEFFLDVFFPVANCICIKTEVNTYVIKKDGID